MSKPLDPEAPSTYKPVIRNGKKPEPTVRPGKGGLLTAEPVKYPDGVSLTVKGIAHGVEKGIGPGAFPGRPYTAISLSLENGSTRSINLSQVVVTTMYGSSPARVASPVYADPAAKDFTGTVKPGDSASAKYAFAIPTEQAGNVVTIVDFDDVHVAARFTGSAR